MRSLLLLVLLFASQGFAAESRIRVLDPAGSPIAGATILVTSPDGSVATLATGRDGSAVIEAAPEATVAVELAGFVPVLDTVAALSAAPVVLEPAIHEESVTVTAAQSRVPLAEVSSAVTVVSGERLRDELATSRNLADALGKLVPGLSPGSGSASIYGQTIRGRAVQVLVDGAPLTTLRNTSRDLVAVDPSVIERIDVLRGTTALYGDGATGGLINIVTRKPSAGALALETTLSTGLSLTHPSESVGGRLAQSIAGTTGSVDWRADLALDRTGAFFDAEGDRIQPDPYGQGGMSDSAGISLMGKIGWNLAPGQRLQLSLTSFESEQDTEWTADPSVNALPALSVKSRPIRGLQMDHPQGSTNRLLHVSYEDASVFGSRVAVQGFGRDYQTIFTPFDGRPYAVYGHKIFQSRLESESLGFRIDIETPVPVRGMTLFWGADATTEETEQPVWIMDPETFSSSGGRVIRTIDDRTWVPLIDKEARAAFAQLEWMPVERWLVRGGVRHESVDAGIPTFSTLAGNTIEGGSRAWSDTLFNVGVVRYLGSAARVWTGFSQGFSLPDIGLVLRSAPAGATLDTLPFQPQIVDAFEVGTSAEFQRWSGSLAAYYSTSEHGTSTAGFNQPVVRAPERVYGFEAGAELHATERWTVGGNFAFSEGKTDPDRDGEYTWLNHYRIAPPNASVFVEHQTLGWWSNRISVLHSGDRDRFPGSTLFGERPIESYTVVDWLMAFDLRRGRLELGIENVLNEEYFVRDAQLLRSGRNDSHSMAPGAQLSLAWSMRY